MDEQHFHEALTTLAWQYPGEQIEYHHTLLVFADWLEEQGDPRAELIRLQESLRLDPTPEERQQAEPKLQGLIHSGVKPVVGTWQNSLGMEFCWCPPGKFLMGNPLHDKFRKPQEELISVELLAGFWLGKYLVTQDVWHTLMGTKPWSKVNSVRDGGRFPASCISWPEAVKFCHKLNELEIQSAGLPIDWSYSLPYELQWEYACRAGTNTLFSFGDDPGYLDDYAWYHSNTSAFPIREHYPHEVGRKLPNPWGFYDMHGNVWEWCQDLWEEGQLGETVSPEYRSMRGGSFYEGPGDCKSARRGARVFDDETSLQGFRVAIQSPRERPGVENYPADLDLA